MKRKLFLPLAHFNKVGLFCDSSKSLGFTFIHRLVATLLANVNLHDFNNVLVMR